MNRLTKHAALPMVLVALAFALGACDQDLTEVNENPNAPTSVPPATLLPEAIGATADLTWDSFWQMSIWGTFSQNTALIQYPDEEKYDIRVSSLEGYWNSFYQGPLKDYQSMIDLAEEQGKPNVQAVALIMKSYVFQQLTDAWGPVPYSEALNLEGGEQTPAYDGEEAIYTALLENLDRARGLIDPGNVSAALPGNDILYGGDMAKWRSFANSLTLKMAMRISNVDEGTASSIVDDDLAGGVFQSNAEHARIDYPGGENQNPIYVNGLTRDDHAPGEPMLSRMRDWQDPRVPVYAEPCPNCDPSDSWDVKYIGGTIAQGGEPRPLGDIARIGSFWRGNPQAPHWFMSHAEVEFFLAEAAYRGFISGSAQEHYEAGIRASMNQYGISGQDVDDYLQQAGVAWDGSDMATAMQQIGVQKWISLYMGGPAIEAYAEIRRLGYPAIAPGPQALNVNDGHPPTRIPYPPLEQSLNNEELQAAIQMLGGDDYSQTVYWDPDGTVP